MTRSPLINRLLDKAHSVALGSSRVLISGESGSGKELLATAMHKASAQKDGELVIMKCSTMAENLLEAELFGRAADTFSDDPEQRSGLYQRAQNGTLILDEVADMPMRLQVKLLRVIEEQVIRPVGSSESVPVKRAPDFNNAQRPQSADHRRQIPGRSLLPPEPNDSAHANVKRTPGRHPDIG